MIIVIMMRTTTWCIDCERCKNLRGVKTAENKEVSHFIIDCSESDAEILVAKRFYGYLKCGEFQLKKEEGK
jgi:hypothetical protein